MQSFGRRLAELARLHGSDIAVTFVRAVGGPTRLTWGELESRSNQVARLLAQQGIGSADIVAVQLPNSIDHLLAALAVWKLGGCVLPLSRSLPQGPLEEILQVAQARYLVDGGLDRAADLDDSELEDRVSQPGRATATGGSTGRPKIIVDPSPWCAEPGDFIAALGPRLGMRAGQVQLVGAALHHLVPFVRSHYGLFEDQSLIVMEKFDAGTWLDVVEEYGVQFTYLVPTMMNRIVKRLDFAARDLRSLEALTYGGAPCPPWLVRAWIERLGATRVYESYGASEMPGWLSIRGDEWLAHPGSVGREETVDIVIKGETGSALPPGEVGELFIRDRAIPGTPYRFLGAPGPVVDEAGFVSVGDLGRLDEDRYLYLVDRRSDLILTGGVNVYVAEVEAALTAHPEVGDVVVLGLPDEDWGRRVHAIVQPLDPSRPPSAAELDEFARRSLPPEKLPKSYELVTALPRDDAGKVPRAALLAERVAPR